MRRLTFVFVLALVSALALGCGEDSREPSVPAGEQPSISAGDGKIAFDASDGTIGVVEPDGSGYAELVELGEYGRQYEHPDWSPDGARLAVSSVGLDDIVVIDADGSNPRNLTAGYGDKWHDSSPAWSQDGTRIVFESSEETTYSSVGGLAVMQADGSGKRLLPTPPDEFILFADWSPDGEQLVFSSFGGEDDESSFWVRLYLIDADGSGAARLCSSGAGTRSIRSTASSRSSGRAGRLTGRASPLPTSPGSRRRASAPTWPSSTPTAPTCGS